MGMSARNTALIERLFAEQRTKLQSFFRRRIRDKLDVSDLAQEVYLRILRVADADSIRNPEAYMFTVAANLVKEHSVVARRQLHEVDVEGESMRDHLATLSTAETEMETAQKYSRLYEVVTRLPVRCRLALILQYRDGLSYREIAAQLNVSSGMVKKYLAQGLELCRKHMAASE
jgi:RNA polymerase sigma factor (sigma-70 family)